MLKAVWYNGSIRTPCWLQSVKIRDGYNNEAVIVLDEEGELELHVKSVKLKDVRVLRRLGLDVTEP